MSPAPAATGLRSLVLRPLALLAALLAAVTPSPAEDTFPPRDGLVLWLDASAQARARQAASFPPLLPAQGLDALLDTSPSSRHFFQPLPERRPRFVTDGTTAFLRFDGDGDFLSATGDRRLAAEVSFFILASPAGNPGFFTGLFAASAHGENDYTHGINIDLGAQPTDVLSVVNVESAGATGMRDLLQPSLLGAAERPFGGFHVLTVRSKVAEQGTEFFLDGFKGGARDRLESMIALDQMVLGARLYSNDPSSAPFAQGFFRGDVAAVAVYDRWVGDEERALIEQGLMARAAELTALAAGRAGHPLEVVADPPPVQMLVPGFSVEEIPLEIGNLTSIRYRHDGKLVALGYDGRVHLVEDTDGDGTPDTAALWWDQNPLVAPIGLALLPAGDPRGEGAFVASKSKLSLLLDRDRDGRAEEEIVVATGWPVSFHGVDVLGAAIHPHDGSIYFSIGCTNFADPYLVDASGNSGYRLDSPRGTVQRVSADLQTRETVATGLRFLCALAFNREGDLFATEQEGATWVPNGNPFDELLHIVPGRHYGFPPRHPKHLPDVIDEPAVFEYAPQHQSACGMVFNEGVNGGPAFGPPHWHGDALVCGQSRGKLWRTKLAKSPEGYVAQNHLIACLNLLTVDACVTPQGDLLVACHSGPPDWGTGPAGEGTLFRIRWADPDLPQPVTAWAAAPDEFRIAFDRPLPDADWIAKASDIRIEAGEFVGPGDRFESVRPGYQVVRDQMASPRRWVPVEKLALTADRRTLVLRVPPQTRPETYAITLPIPDAWETASPLAQSPTLDVALTLNGLVAAGAAGGAAEQVPETVIPHPSLSISHALTTGSADHERFFQAAPDPVQLRARIDRTNIFQPPTQPGSTLDWDIASDPFANRQMTVRDNESGEELAAGTTADALTEISHSLAADSRLVFALDDRVRPINPNRLFTPWAEASGSAADPDAPAPPRTDVAGDWLRGRQLYFGAATCWTCHTIRGEGLAFGADLTNLVHRDRDSVLADILQPSATINPDHAGSVITKTDGTSAVGVVAESSDDRIVLRLPAGARQEIPRSAIASIAPMEASLMPEGFGQILSETDREDLLTFLLTVPLQPAPITRTDPGPPPARPLAEVAPLLPPPAPPAAPNDGAPAPLHVLLCGSDKDHGLDEHDYPLWLERWSTLLSLAPNVTVTTAMGFPDAAQLAVADVTVFYSSNAGWDLRAAKTLADYQDQGGGLAYLHWGIEGHRHARELADRIGLAFSFSAFRHGPLDLVLAPVDHPIIDGIPSPLHLIDESYWKLHGDRSKISVLGHSVEDGNPEPQIWVKETGGSRVFGCIPGHYTWTLDDPLYRILVLRGICWAAGDPDIDRLADLALVGARFDPVPGGEQ
ncbi:hypothetical protein BH23VER1_BH23VER1_28200 [soil metagenome]